MPRWGQHGGLIRTPAAPPARCRSSRIRSDWRPRVRDCGCAVPPPRRAERRRFTAESSVASSRSLSPGFGDEVCGSLLHGLHRQLHSHCGRSPAPRPPADRWPTLPPAISGPRRRRRRPRHEVHIHQAVHRRHPDAPARGGRQGHSGKSERIRNGASTTAGRPEGCPPLIVNEEDPCGTRRSGRHGCPNTNRCPGLLYAGGQSISIGFRNLLNLLELELWHASCDRDCNDRTRTPNRHGPAARPPARLAPLCAIRPPRNCRAGRRHMAVAGNSRSGPRLSPAAQSGEHRRSHHRSLRGLYRRTYAAPWRR